MRRAAAIVIGCLAWAGGAAAQDWIAQGSPAEGWTGATTCVPGGSGGTVTALCLSLGCRTGLGPGATLSLSDARRPPRLDAVLSVDGEVAGVLDFRPDASGVTYGAPLDEQDRLVEALRMGRSAEIRLEFQGGAIRHPLSLAGSRAAIDAVLEACPSPAFEAQPGLLARRTSDDPAATAIAENEAFCAGGATTVEPGFLRQADVDGDGVNDVLIDYLGLTCDGARAFCGTGGCTQEIWLGDSEGPYRRLVSDLLERIELPAPGRVRLIKDGADCGRSGAETCGYEFRVEGGLLQPVD